MDNDIQELKVKFNSISKMGWIKSVSRGFGGVGNTFEHLLNKPRENLEIPDYNGIEIKTRNAIVNQYIAMFNATPDGTYMFETKRLRDSYGYPDKKIKNVKVFNISVSANEVTKVGYKHLFKLMVDRKEEKIFLCIFNKNNELIDKQTFWTFQLLEEKLHRKMQTLAIIDATYKKENNEIFYKYKSINFYKLTGFDSFINAIESGIIRITFKISTFRDEKRYGQMHDHGTGFEIKESDLKQLYNKIM